MHIRTQTTVRKEPHHSQFPSGAEKQTHICYVAPCTRAGGNLQVSETAELMEPMYDIVEGVEVMMDGMKVFID